MVTVIPISRSIVPTIAHANQVGIRALSHLTAPIATNAIPMNAITIPARIRPTDRANRLTKRSTGLATPPSASRRTNFTSFSVNPGFSDSSGNASA